MLHPVQMLCCASKATLISVVFTFWCFDSFFHGQIHTLLSIAEKITSLKMQMLNQFIGRALRKIKTQKCKHNRNKCYTRNKCCLWSTWNSLIPWNVKWKMQNLITRETMSKTRYFHFLCLFLWKYTWIVCSCKKKSKEPQLVYKYNSPDRWSYASALLLSISRMV